MGKLGSLVSMVNLDDALVLKLSTVCLSVFFVEGDTSKLQLNALWCPAYEI